MANRVEPELQPADPRRARQARRDLDHLGVERRARGTDGLDVELEELAVPAFLWAVVAEHRPEEIQPNRLRTLVEAALEICPDDAGGCPGTQGKHSPAPGLEKAKAPRERSRGFTHPPDEVHPVGGRGRGLPLNQP